MQPQPPKAPNGYLCVGVITGAHGILGALKFKPFITHVTLLTQTSQILTQTSQNLTISAIKSVGKGQFSLTCPAVSSRTEAEKWQGIHLYAPRSLFGEDLIYQDFIGLIAQFSPQDIVGDIINVFSNGAQPVLEIQPIDNKQKNTILIPYADIYTHTPTPPILTLKPAAKDLLTL